VNKVLICRAGLLPFSETFIKEQMQAYARWHPVLVGTHRTDPCLAMDGMDVRILHQEHPTVWSRMFKRFFREIHVAPPGVVRKLRNEAASLVHIHFATDATDYWPSVRQLNLPVIVTLHGYDITIRKEWWQSPAAPLAMRNYPQRLLEMSRYSRVHFVAVSEAIRRRAIDYGLPPDRISVQYTGVDLARFRFSGRPVTQRRRRILFVGRLVEKKGGECLIRAFASLRQTIADAELVMIGEGPLRAKLEALAHELNVPVEFTGSRASDVVKEQIDSARVLCLPSIIADNGDAEGFGMVILEAQASGVPVVTSALGGATEGIVDGVTGFSFSEGDVAALSERLTRLLTDDALAESMSAAAPRFVAEKFDIRSCTRSLEDLYDRVVAATAPVSARATQVAL
jgi:glycosyltransferase involved in cell wall biosynthesis